MKKMNVAVFLVLMVVSASNALADVSCADIQGEIDAKKANIALAKQEILRWGEYDADINTRIILSDKKRNDDSLILGNGQPHLREESLQVQRLRGNYQVGILRDLADIEVLKAEYKEMCSSFDKFDY
jgi:hypothetical protein